MRTRAISPELCVRLFPGDFDDRNGGVVVPGKENGPGLAPEAVGLPALPGLVSAQPGTKAKLLKGLYLSLYSA